jgi:hypothetical protein
MMIKAPLFRLSLFLFSLGFISLLHATPDTTKKDPLQLYRDQIKQAESNASQAVLDQLKSSIDDPTDDNTDARPSTHSQSAATPSLPHSNSDKAFIAPAADDLKHNTTQPSSTQANPWLKPNPWGEVKKNPWANVPIPGPSSPPTAATNSSIPSPPNIFAPPQQPSNKTPSYVQR